MTVKRTNLSTKREVFFARLFLGALIMLIPLAAAAEFHSTPREQTWVTDGAVRAIVHTANTIYIGGDFTYVGPNTGSGVPINTSTGAALSTFPRVNGEIRACLPDGSGGWFIGGNFTQVASYTRNRIAHILSDYTVDAAWDPNANGAVYSLAVSGTTLYAGGRLHDHRRADAKPDRRAGRCHDRRRDGLEPGRGQRRPGACPIGDEGVYGRRFHDHRREVAKPHRRAGRHKQYKQRNGLEPERRRHGQCLGGLRDNGVCGRSIRDHRRAAAQVSCCAGRHHEQRDGLGHERERRCLGPCGLGNNGVCGRRFHRHQLTVAKSNRRAGRHDRRRNQLGPERRWSNLFLGGLGDDGVCGRPVHEHRRANAI